MNAGGVSTTLPPSPTPQVEQRPEAAACPLHDRPHSWISCGNIGCRGY
jgi:hypothetical protein